MKKPEKYLWLDLETTGLVPTKDAILALGIVITDTDLKELYREEWVIGHKNLDLNQIPLEVLKMHLNNGLLEKVAKSRTGLNDVWESLKPTLQEHFDKNPITLAGNSVHFDRGFIRAQIPPLYKHLNYRQLDVSSLRLVIESISSEFELVKPTPKHMPLDDIANSIDQLRYYISLLPKKKLGTV